MKENGSKLFMLLLVFVLAAAVLTGSAEAALPTQGVFIQNLGQWDNRATFHMLIGDTKREPHYRMEAWLTESGYIYQLSDLTAFTEDLKDVSLKKSMASNNISQHAVSVSFLGGQKAAIEAMKPAPGKFNWLVGNDKSSHVTGAKAYHQVIYRNIYPGIDVTFDAVHDKGLMETTYTVAPGATPETIVLNYNGGDAVRIDSDGNLVIATSLGNITEMKPVAFQKDSFGKHQPVPVAFALKGKNLTFRVASYDKSRVLYIDPVVIFSRTFGGSSTESVASMHEDSTGRYFTGVTASGNFPATVGAYQQNLSGSYDLFAAKFDLANATLLWATYLGSSGAEYGGNSALVSDGSLYLVATTTSAVAWPPNPPGFTYGTIGGGIDIGIAHLSSNGQNILASAVIGGTSTDYAGDIAISGAGDIYVCGSTNLPQSSNFPMTPAGFNKTQAGSYDAYILRFNAALSNYMNMTLIPGGTANDGCSGLAFDLSNNVYAMGITLEGSYPATTTIGPVGNYDLFIAKYDAALSTQSYNVLIGGTSTDPTPGFSYVSIPDYYYQTGYNGIIVDSSNRAWVTGTSASTDFPTTPGAYQTTNGGNYDVFVLALNPAGTALVYSTFIGGNSTDGGRSIKFDSKGNVYVAGFSASPNYPTTAEAVQQTNAGSYDFVLSVLSPDLSSLIFSTYWGGVSGSDFGGDLAVGPDYTARISGISSSGFPQVPAESPVFGPGGNYDGAVVSLDFRDIFNIAVPGLTGWGIAIFVLLAGLVASYALRRKRIEN